MALLGALIAQSARGLLNDVYCQIGMVMLIGLASKNGILIVEFAEELRDKGLSITDAAVQAAKIRLRRILMTSFAFILGGLSRKHVGVSGSRKHLAVRTPAQSRPHRGRYARAGRIWESYSRLGGGRYFSSFSGARTNGWTKYSSTSRHQSDSPHSCDMRSNAGLACCGGICMHPGGGAQFTAHRFACH
jgi:hypothetical protein